MKLKCEGGCFEDRTCLGEVVTVHVEHPNHDWGNFNYCQTAIEEDRSRGLTVTILTEQPTV